jgi:hypothetical protein
MVIDGAGTRAVWAVVEASSNLADDTIRGLGSGKAASVGQLVGRLDDGALLPIRQAQQALEMLGTTTQEAATVERTRSGLASLLEQAERSTVLMQGELRKYEGVGYHGFEFFRDSALNSLAYAASRSHAALVGDLHASVAPRVADLLVGLRAEMDEIGRSADIAAAARGAVGSTMAKLVP